MTIDKEQLVELLVEKTSMSTEEINTQLDQLIERILDASKRGKALEIKEFGAFYFDEEGELRFDPAEELSTEISFKYAGMKPVELKAERDTSIPDIEEDDEDDFDDSLEVDEDEDDPFAEPFDEFDSDEKQEADFDFIADPGMEEDSPFDFDEKDHEDEESITIDDPLSSESSEPPEEPEEKKKTNVADFKPISRHPVKRRDNTGLYILIGIILVAVLVGAYFYYINTQSNTSVQSEQSTLTEMQPGTNETEDTGANEATDSQTDDTQETETEPNQEVEPDNQTPTERAEPIQGTDEETASEIDDADSETDQPLYGLTGSVTEEANSGFSIVVHSFRDENRAIATERADQLRADGYRVMVTSRTVNENLVWRVSVGQFETVADAQQAATQLPEPHNTQNFIQRIRIN